MALCLLVVATTLEPPIHDLVLQPREGGAHEAALLHPIDIVVADTTGIQKRVEGGIIPLMSGRRQDRNQGGGIEALRGNQEGH